MPEYKRLRTNAPPDEQSVNQLILRDQGLKNIPSRITGIDNATEAALALRNAGLGGALEILNRAGSATLLYVDDDGVDIGAPLEVLANSAVAWALTVRNQGAGGQGLRVLNAAGSSALLTVADAAIAATTPLSVTANTGAAWAVDVRNSNATGQGLRVLNAAGTEARLSAAQAGVTVTGNDAAVYALIVRNIGTGGLGLQVRNAANTANVFLVLDTGIDVTGLANILANDNANYALTVRNAGTNGAALKVRNAADTADQLFVNDTGTYIAPLLMVGDTANAQNTFGLTVNQLAADDECVSLKSSDVATGLTSVTETDTYSFLKKATANGGGLRIFGLAESGETVGMRLDATAGTDTTTKSTAADGKFTLHAWANSGSSVGSVGANGNLLAVTNGGTTRFIIDAEGDVHADAGSGAANSGTGYYAYDEYDDAQLVRALEVERGAPGLVREEAFDDFLAYGRADLERARIAAFNDDSVFVNYSALARLHSGALWQLYRRVGALERALAAGGANG